MTECKDDLEDLITEIQNDIAHVGSEVVSAKKKNRRRRRKSNDILPENDLSAQKVGTVRTSYTRNRNVGKKSIENKKVCLDDDSDVINLDERNTCDSEDLELSTSSQDDCNEKDLLPQNGGNWGACHASLKSSINQNQNEKIDNPDSKSPNQFIIDDKTESHVDLKNDPTDIFVITDQKNDNDDKKTATFVVVPPSKCSTVGKHQTKISDRTCLFSSDKKTDLIQKKNQIPIRRDSCLANDKTYTVFLEKKKKIFGTTKYVRLFEGERQIYSIKKKGKLEENDTLFVCNGGDAHISNKNRVASIILANKSMDFSLRDLNGKELLSIRICSVKSRDRFHHYVFVPGVLGNEVIELFDNQIVLKNGLISHFDFIERMRKDVVWASVEIQSPYSVEISVCEFLDPLRVMGLGAVFILCHRKLVS